MIIITAVMYSIPYFICLFWFLHLRKQNKKQRIEFLDFKIVTSENFRIANKNYKGQDENWVKIESYMKRNDELNSIQSYINIDNLEIFQEFDSIIQELDKKVNTALDDQEKYSIKRDRYENRLTEVCKAFDSASKLINEMKVVINNNIDITRQNFDNVDTNFDHTRKLFALTESKINELDRTLNLSLQRIGMNKVKFENLIKAIENPIEVTRPSCETKLKMKEQVNSNDIQTVNKIKNKFDFECGILEFKKGYTFQIFSNLLTVHRYGKIHYRFPIKDDYTTVLWEKLLKVNEPKQKRKYTKRTIKNQN